MQFGLVFQQNLAKIPFVFAGNHHETTTDSPISGPKSQEIAVNLSARPPQANRMKTQAKRLNHKLQAIILSRRTIGPSMS